MSEGVCIYVASANTKPVTELCVRTIHRTAGHAFGLVVGDVGSGDGSVPMLRRLEAEGWLHLELSTTWRQHFEWLDTWRRSCPARYALFVDSDVAFVGNNWLAELMDTAVSTRAALVCAQMYGEERNYVHPGGGAVMRLAARPGAHLLLVDVEAVKDLEVSFAPVLVDPAAVPEGRVSYDVAALVFAEVVRRGLGWVEMPLTFGAKFRHFGGMSWKTRKLWPDLWPGWAQARDLTKIRLALAWYRRRWRAPSPWHGPLEVAAPGARAPAAVDPGPAGAGSTGDSLSPPSAAGPSRPSRQTGPEHPAVGLVEAT
jgi:hypothetical protein